MFGGGITIENGGLADFTSAWKSWLSIQRAYHFGSTDLGSYVFGSSAIAMKVAQAPGLAKCKKRKAEACATLFAPPTSAACKTHAPLAFSIPGLADSRSSRRCERRYLTNRFFISAIPRACLTGTKAAKRSVATALRWWRCW